MRVLVVVPTYEEAMNIAVFLQRLHASNPDVDVLVVDDNSPDGTADIAQSFNGEFGKIEVLRRPKKSGLGSAYRDGFSWGLDHGYDAMVEIDADLSHDPSVLPELLRTVEHGADLAIGSRYVSGGSIPNWAWHRKALSRYGNRYASAMLSFKVHDSTAGYRVYRAQVLKEIDFDSVHADGYGFQIEMTHLAAKLGRQIVEVPIHFVDRTRGVSKMSSRIVVEALLLVTWWGVRDRMKKLLHLSKG